MEKLMEPLADSPSSESADLSGELLQPPVTPSSNADYVVAVINMTDVVLTKQRVRVGGGAWTSWFTMQPIPRTCRASTPKECFEKGAYVAVTTIGCGGEPFAIELRSDDGKGAVWANLYADCQRAGGVVTLTP